MANSSSEVIPNAELGSSVAISGDGNIIVGGGPNYNPTYDGGSNFGNCGAFQVITGT